MVRLGRRHGVALEVHHLLDELAGAGGETEGARGVSRPGADRKGEVVEFVENVLRAGRVPERG